MSTPKRANILGVGLSIVDMREAVEQCDQLIAAGGRGYICAVDAHSLVEALGDPGHRTILNQASLTVADGMPMVWMGWLRGNSRMWYEAFPLVIAESLAAGLPILASRLGAMTEIVADGATGRLFAPGNPAELAGAVEWALSHSDEMRRMRLRARAEYEEKYTAEANYARLMAIYEKALEISPARARLASRLEAIG